MANAVTKRDEQQSAIEDNKAQISAEEAKKAQLQEEIAELSKEIADLKKALQEATELRAAENLEYEKTKAEAGAGKEAVAQAISFLKDYYGSFLQRSTFVPANSDREGKTVADLAPEVFDAEYNGNQDASKGIMGLLEVILSDFDRTATTSEAEEKQAQKDYDEFKKTNEENTVDKEGSDTVVGSVPKKESEITGIDTALTGLQDDLKTAQGLHQDALELLAELHTQCVAGEETYEERVANRKKEIEALKEAHNILEDWQK